MSTEKELTAVNYFNSEKLYYERMRPDLKTKEISVKLIFQFIDGSFYVCNGTALKIPMPYNKSTRYKVMPLSTVPDRRSITKIFVIGGSLFPLVAKNLYDHREIQSSIMALTIIRQQDGTYFWW